MTPAHPAAVKVDKGRMKILEDRAAKWIASLNKSKAINKSNREKIAKEFRMN